jgi:hypothetical protein
LDIRRAKMSSELIMSLLLAAIVVALVLIIGRESSE